MRSRGEELRGLVGRNAALGRGRVLLVWGAEALERGGRPVVPCVAALGRTPFLQEGAGREEG